MPHPPGRPPWTTTEQYKFLEEYLPRLEGEKAGNGLTQFYARITRDFSAIWEPPVVEKDRTAAKNVDELQKLAYNRRGRVSHHSLILHMPPTDCYRNSKSPTGSRNNAKPPPLPLSPSLFLTSPGGAAGSLPLCNCTTPSLFDTTDRKDQHSVTK